MVALLVDLASRTGLFDAPATGPGTSAEVASRAGLERHVRECLGALVTAGVAVPFALSLDPPMGWEPRNAKMPL